MITDQRTINKIIEAANVISRNRQSEADWIQIPYENIKAISKANNVSEAEVLMLLGEYFKPSK